MFVKLLFVSHSFSFAHPLMQDSHFSLQWHNYGGVGCMCPPITKSLYNWVGSWVIEWKGGWSPNLLTPSTSLFLSFPFNCIIMGGVHVPSNKKSLCTWYCSHVKGGGGVSPNVFTHNTSLFWSFPFSCITMRVGMYMYPPIKKSLCTWDGSCVKGGGGGSPFVLTHSPSMFPSFPFNSVTMGTWACALQ